MKTDEGGVMRRREYELECAVAAARGLLLRWGEEGDAHRAALGMEIFGRRHRVVSDAGAVIVRDPAEELRAAAAASRMVV